MALSDDLDDLRDQLDSRPPMVKYGDKPGLTIPNLDMNNNLDTVVVGGDVAIEAARIALAAGDDAFASKQSAEQSATQAATSEINADSSATAAANAADRAEAIADFDGLHNSLAGRNETGAHDASAIGFEYKGVSTNVHTSLNALLFKNIEEMKSATDLKVGMIARTLGYYAPGDGGGNDYEIVAAGTGTDDGGSFINLSGSGFQSKGLFVGGSTPFQFGVKSNLIDDDATPLERYLNFTNTPSLNGLSCRVTRMLSVTPSTDYELTVSNSLISLDSTEPQEKVLDIVTTGQRIIISGSLIVDANDNAFCGIYIDGLTSERELCIVDGVTVRNIYRIDTRFTLGDGIFIRGGFRKLTATNFIIENVKMATGALVPFTYGVTGITVFRYSTGVHSNDITVSNFAISNVYSEDRSNLMRDQDGVRIMQSYKKSYISTELTQPSRALVSNGRLLNAMGRAVKMVSEYGIVENLQIVRNEAIHTNFTMSESEDIDFQCGGGTIKGIRCHYHNNVPYSLVNFNVNIVSGRRTPTQCLIDDVAVSLYGVLSMNAIVAASTSNPITDTQSIKVVVNDSSVTGALNPLDSVVTLNNGADIALYFFVSVSNTTARLGTSLVKRTNPTTVNSLLLTSCANQNTGNSAVPASTGLTTVNDEIALIGINRRIS